MEELGLRRKAILLGTLEDEGKCVWAQRSRLDGEEVSFEPDVGRSKLIGAMLLKKESVSDGPCR